MSVNWFQENSWLASWIAAWFVVAAEGTIIYLLVKYLRGFLGKASSTEMKIIQWKFSQLTSLTASDLVRLKDERPELYNEYMEQYGRLHPQVG
jgi:hypothetical protein